MSFDRRRHPRKVPQSFTFLQLEQDEGGRVLNISEEGLCFEAFTPIRTANPVHLWFSFNLRDRIEATGNVAWTDAGDKLGGLVFTHLSPSAREQIRSQIAEIPTGNGAKPEGGPNGELTPRDSFFHASGKKTTTAWPLEAVPTPQKSIEQSGALQKPVSALRETSALPGYTPLVPWERYLSASRAQFVRGLLLGIAITTVIAAPVFRYLVRSQRNVVSKGVSDPRSPETPGPQTDPQGISNPADPASPAAAPAFLPITPSSRTATDSPASTYTPAIRKSAAEYVRSKASQTAPPASSNGSANSKSSAATPDQLWEAVQAGNAKAAVTLADLYLRGDGVPANCAQAKILLDFATQKKNAEARKKAQALDKAGCPAP